MAAIACLQLLLKAATIIIRSIVSKSKASFPDVFSKKFSKIMYYCTFLLILWGANPFSVIGMYKRTPPLNDWHYVTITYDSETKPAENGHCTLRTKMTNSGLAEIARITVMDTKSQELLRKEFLVLMTYI